MLKFVLELVDIIIEAIRLDLKVDVHFVVADTTVSNGVDVDGGRVERGRVESGGGREGRGAWRRRGRRLEDGDAEEGADERDVGDVETEVVEMVMREIEGGAEEVKDEVVHMLHTVAAGPVVERLETSSEGDIDCLLLLLGRGGPEARDCGATVAGKGQLERQLVGVAASSWLCQLQPLPNLRSLNLHHNTSIAHLNLPCTLPLKQLCITKHDGCGTADYLAKEEGFPSATRRIHWQDFAGRFVRGASAACAISRSSAQNARQKSGDRMPTLPAWSKWWVRACIWG